MRTSCNLCIRCLGVVLTILIIPSAKIRSDSPSLTKEQWREDLKFLARELPKRHANAFHYTSRERFEAEVADLDRRLDRLNADEIYAGLNRIANLVGDGHTFVYPGDAAILPLHVMKFGADYRV